MQLKDFPVEIAVTSTNLNRKKREVFYPAENYHQQYYELNGDSNPYCQLVIRPKLEKFRKVFKDKLKKDYGLDDDEFAVIWSEAYDRGHSGGFHEIYTEFDSLYDFALKYVEIVNKKKK